MPIGSPRRRFAATVIAVLAAVGLVGCAADDGPAVEVPAPVDRAFPDETATQLQDAVTHAMQASGASGAVVGVWAPWSGAWTAGIGTQDVGGGEEISTETRIHAVRLSRPMICDVLYALVDEGRVALDDELPPLVSGTAGLDGVTLGQLCDGTSGIGSYAGQLRALWLANPARSWSPRELASYGLGQEREAEPGASFRDSDAGYVLLGLALERVTGMRASQLIQEYVAGPLGLEQTSLPSGPVSGGEGPAVMTGHIPEPGDGGAVDCSAPRDMADLSLSTGFTDSGVVSDLEDLRRYVQALATGALTPDGIDRFADPKPLSAGAPSWLNTAGGAVLAGSLVGQYGTILGTSTAAYADPESGLTVVVSVNSSAGGVANALAWELAAIASKAPATDGEAAPQAGLPWTAEQYRQAIADGAVCAPAA